MAGFIFMHPLGDTKHRNATRPIGEAGDLEVHGVQYAHVQILIVEDIFAGRRFVTSRSGCARLAATSAGADTVGMVYK